MPVTSEQREQIYQTLKDQPGALTAMVARQVGVPEAAVFEAVEGQWAWALDPGRFDAMMEVLKGWGTVMVALKNRHAIMESVGRLGGYSRAMGYFNIQSKGIDMHIKSEGIASIYFVNRPAHAPGMPTHSVQCFDEEGQPVLKVFLRGTAGNQKPSKAAQAACDHLIEFTKEANEAQRSQVGHRGQRGHQGQRSQGEPQRPTTPGRPRRYRAEPPRTKITCREKQRGISP